MRIRRCFFGLIVLLAASNVGLHSASAQIFDRSAFYDAKTKLSDNPRQVPMRETDEVEEPYIALTNGRVFDGVQLLAERDGILIRGNKIVRLLKAGSLNLPDAAHVVDVKGATIMPGLIDLHVHMTYTETNVPQRLAVSEVDQTLRAIERLRFYVESGITTIRDMGSQGDVPFRLKDWSAEHRLPLPRIFAAGQVITGTGGHGAEELDQYSPIYGEVVEVSGADAWRDEVRRQFKRGADLIKLASHFSREEVRAATQEAHDLGLRVAVDAETQYIKWAVEAGADDIEHPLPRDETTIEMMAKMGTVSVPTLTPYEYIFDRFGGYYGSTSRRFSFSKEANLSLVRKMRSAGITLGVGTDLVLDWFRYLPDAYISELKLLKKTGLGTEEALSAATKINAEILGMGHKLGTLTPGKLADIIVVNGNPDINLEHLRKVAYVIRDGQFLLTDGRIFVEPHTPLPEPEAKVSN